MFLNIFVLSFPGASFARLYLVIRFTFKEDLVQNENTASNCTILNADKNAFHIMLEAIFLSSTLSTCRYPINL